MRNLKLAQIAVDYLKNFIGLPYKWAGDDPMEGFDCSGLCIEMLKAVGLINDKMDMSAKGLQIHYKNFSVDYPLTGCLVFFGRDKPTHVGVCLTDRLMIESGGGDRNVVNMNDASRKNAYIRIRPINRRKDILGYVDPFMER